MHSILMGMTMMMIQPVCYPQSSKFILETVYVLPRIDGRMASLAMMLTMVLTMPTDVVTGMFMMTRPMGMMIMMMVSVA